MNMAYNDRLILVTEDGYVIALFRDLTKYRTVKMALDEGAGAHAEEMETQGRMGHGWVRNPYAIDDSGGIYIVSYQYMHKVIWTGNSPVPRIPFMDGH